MKDVVVLDKKINVTELQMQKLYIKHLEEMGIKDIEEEVFMLGGLCDVVYIDKRRRFICVELKLTDWRKVIEQAKKHFLMTPYVYICMPLPSIYKRNKIEAIVEKEGLGLVWWNYENVKGKTQTILWKTERTPTEKKEKNGHEYFNKEFLERPFYNCLYFTFMTKCVDYKNGFKR